MSEPKNKHSHAAAADLEVLQRTTAADFDGHTELHRLSPRQRLAWLDEAVAFITSAKRETRASAHPLGSSASEVLRLVLAANRQPCLPPLLKIPVSRIAPGP